MVGSAPGIAINKLPRETRTNMKIRGVARSRARLAAAEWYHQMGVPLHGRLILCGARARMVGNREGGGKELARRRLLTRQPIAL